MIDKKVSQKINENKITLKDILTRKKFWKKPVDKNYLELKIYPGWKWWDKNYKFLPTPDKWQQIKRETEEKLQELPTKEYFIIRNQNNTLTIVLQNFQQNKQLDFLRPDIVLFFGKNPRQPLIPWRMYFINSVDYSNNETLICKITASQDFIWSYYGNFMNSKGQAQITSSQLNNEHSEHRDDREPNQSADICPACDNCYDFCGDLRNKKAVPPGYNSPQVPSWQPKWKVVYTLPKAGFSSANSDFYLKDADVHIPNNLHLKNWHVGALAEFWSTGQPALIFLVDKEHPTGGAFSQQDNSSQWYYEELPQCYNDNPHLLNHSSVQFFFNKKLIDTANLKHVKIRRRNGRLVFCYQIKIRSSVAGILYRLEIGELFPAWELKVRGGLQSTSFLDGLIDSLFGTIGKPIGLGSGGGNDAQGSFFNLAKQAIKGWVKKQVGTDFNQVLTSGRYEEMLGIKAEGLKDEEKPETEQSTERKKKTTTKSQSRVVEPSVFYSNTIDFNYDFWEFANRAIKNPFEIRFEHSELLYNNLINNNNKSPIQNIQCRFSAFKQCVKVGYWQGEANLMWDTNNTMRNILAQGVFFYDNLEELFKPWIPRYRTLQSYTFGALSGIDAGVGEEEVEISVETSTETEELLNADMTNADYGVADYIGSQDANIWREMGHRVHPASWGAGGRDCLGCLCAGGSHNDPNYSFRKEYNFTSGGTLTLKTRGSGEQSCDIPSEGGTVIFEAQGNSGTITLTSTKTTEHRKYNFRTERVDAERQEEYQQQEWDEPEWTDDNTQYNSLIGEVDPEGFEGEPPEQELEQNQENEKPEKEIKEKSGELEREYEKELEKEKEREAEREKERQLERELEREKEKEREKERDLEKEKLRESELQTEKEKKARDAQWEKDKKDA